MSERATLTGKTYREEFGFILIFPLLFFPDEIVFTAEISMQLDGTTAMTP